MAAVSAVHRSLTSITPDTRSVQFDFPYVDVLKIQKEIGLSGVVSLPSANNDSILELEKIINDGEQLCGIYCELPEQSTFKKC